MKKTVIVIVLILFTATICAYIFLTNLKATVREIKNENMDFEYYLNKKIYGTELVSIINKAIDKNEQNKIPKDRNSYYIENSENSIKIYIKMNSTKKTYPMEEIYENNITEFVKYFNLAEFECTEIEYHKETGRISKMFFQEI